MVSYAVNKVIGNRRSDDLKTMFKKSSN